MGLRRNPDGVAKAIAQAKKVALCAHVSPDGDTVGSTLALRLGLMQLGKVVAVFCQDKIPDNLHFLCGADAFRTADSMENETFDLTVAVDAADEARLGTSVKALERAAFTVQVDHHGTNPGYARINDIDPSASATALLVKELLEHLNVVLTPEIGQCLYTGISTDTGNFAFSNTTPEAFRAAGELLEKCHLPLAELNRVLFRQRAKAQTKLIGRALDTMRFAAGGRIAVMTISLQDMADCEAMPEHTDTLVNFGLDTEGVQLAMMARETEDGCTKVSLRAIAPYAVDGIAMTFGGGGHALAAGCTVNSPLQEGAAQVLAAMEKELNGAVQ